jgi:glutathione S-transferase
MQTWPEAQLLPPPSMPAARAHCRSMCAEMHSGFPAVRAQYSMNVRAKLAVPMPPTPQTAAEVARILAMWEEVRECVRCLRRLFMCMCLR